MIKSIFYNNFTASPQYYQNVKSGIIFHLDEITTYILYISFECKGFNYKRCNSIP